MGRARELLNEFTGGLEEFGKVRKSQVKSFMDLLGSVYKPGAVDTKTKELISVAIGLYNRCEYCIVFHVYKAYEHGASREEIVDSAMVSLAFGGGPSMAYSITILKESLDEFEKDF